MADHNALREKLTATSRYRKLLELRKEVQRSRGTIPFSIYAELENRIDEKIKTFEYPMCDQAKINVLFTNGLGIELDPEECFSAIRADMKLSAFIFSKYPSAVDYNIEMDAILGTFGKKTKPEPEAEKVIEKAQINSSPVTYANDGIQKKVDLLMTKIDRLEHLYNETIPKISKSIDEIKEKMDLLYAKMVEQSKL